MHRKLKPFQIIVLGPPVSGKGTQADLLSATFDIPHISIGQILHSIKADKKNSLAKEVAGYMDSGDLVPDELVNKIILERIKTKDCNLGYILDGYPRTINQAEVIAQASNLDYVFLIDVSDKSIIARVTGRRVCPSGHTWHLKYSPSKDSGVCDICGQKLFQRDDDKAGIIKQRLVAYHQNMAPIIDFYDQKKLLIKINGEQHIDQVFREMVRYLVGALRYEVVMKK